jgi:FdhD protein
VSVESIAIDAPPLAVEPWRIEAALLASFPDRLQAVQQGFARSGGLHASGVFTLDGTLVAAAEDVGRHNALDKVIGRALLADLLPLSRHVLAVSGRTSFEIVQKAHLAGLPLVAAVSAPTTMAVALAEAAGITLTGFVRQGRVTVYAHPERVGAAEADSRT